MHSLFLNLSLVFSCIWHVCALETIAAGFIAQNMRCETHAYCLTAHPLAVILVFYFRYAFISAVWNAVHIRCMKLTYWQTFKCTLCLFVLKLAAAVKCTCISEYFYDSKLMCKQSVMFLEQDKTSDMLKQICALVWMQPIKAATVYDLISNNQMDKRKTHNYVCL